MGAEIKRQDIIEDEALEAPLILAANLEKAYMVIQKIAKTSKDVPGFGGGDGMKKTREETEKLTKEQEELIRVQKKLATVQAQNNEAYIKEAAALKTAKQALKEKSELGEKDAKTITAQNASITVLTAALQKNRLEYKKLATEEQRASKEGKELHKIIQQQDKDVKRLNASIGDHRDNVGNYSDALKDLKIKFKDAKDEMVHLAGTLGTASPEFLAAAKNAGALKNEISDIEGSINSLSGSDLENVTGSFGLMGEKLKAADFRGANQAAKQFFETMRGMNFKEAIAGAKAFGATIGKETWKLMKNPFILAAAAIVATGVAMNKLKDDSPLLSKAFDAMGGPISQVTDLFKKLTDAIGLTTFELNKQEKETADATKGRLDMIEKSAQREINIAAAKGERTTELEIKKNDDLIKEAAKGQQALFDLRERFGRDFTEDEKAQFFELADVIAEAENRKAVIYEEARTQERKDRAAFNQYVVEQEAAKQRAIIDNEQKSIDERVEASYEFQRLQLQLAKEARAEALKDPNLSPSARLKIDAEYEAAKTAITKQGVADRQKITDDAVNKYNADIKKQIEADKKRIMDEAARRTAAIDADLDATKKAAIAGNIPIEEADKILAEKKKRYADDYVQIQIDALTKVLGIANLSAEEQAEIEKKLYKLKGDLTQAYFDQLDKGNKRQADDLEEFFKKYKEAAFQFFDSLQQIQSAQTDRQLERIEAEQEAEQKKTDQEVENEDKKTKQLLENRELTDEQRKGIEENAEARKVAIEKAGELRQEALEKKRRQAVRKQALFEKNLSAAKATINLAEAITAMFTAGPAGIVLAAFTAAMGAVQLALIAATPIPAAEKGIKDHKGGAIIAGEKGEELVKMPGGRLALTDAVATVYNFPRGTEIVPHDETMRMLATGSLNVSRAPIRGQRYDRLEKKLDTINSTIKNKREWHLSGTVTGYQDGGTRAKYIESLRNRPY